MRGYILCWLLLAGAVCAGCHEGGWAGGSVQYIKPSIAVMKFENRAPFPLGWDLGDGMKDILVDRLVATRRFHVIERPELDSVIRELRLQHSGATREQRRATLGRIKNVQYLIKGTITDFGHVSTRSGFFAGGGLGVFGSGTRAVMGMTMYVVDVESGEIICSESIQKSVRAKDLAVKASYEGVAFGGTVFYRTPLGRATADVIGEAVKRIRGTVAGRRWRPKIALVRSDGTVVINGGKRRRVKIGTEYEVYEQGDPIVDPDTGDVIGQQPGRLLGNVRVCEVHPGYSVAVVVRGEPSDFRRALHCRPAKAAPSGAKPAEGTSQPSSGQ